MFEKIGVELTTTCSYLGIYRHQLMCFLSLMGDLAYFCVHLQAKRQAER